MSPNAISYNRKCSPAAADGLGYHPRDLYQHCKNPISVNTFWGMSSVAKEEHFVLQQKKTSQMRSAFGLVDITNPYRILERTLMESLDIPKGNPKGILKEPEIIPE